MRTLERRPSWTRAVLGVAIRPWLWPVAALQARHVARPGWWHRPPFLPVPDPAYLQFRLETQYGRDGAPAPRDLVTYLEWCRSELRTIRSGARRARR